MTTKNTVHHAQYYKIKILVLNYKELYPTYFLAPVYTNHNSFQGFI